MPSILIQKGHHKPREPGFENATGAAGEQFTVGLIGDALAKILASDPRFRVRVIPGKVPPDVRSGAYEVDLFLTLHCDGSPDKTRRGWGVGYPAGDVNFKFAQLLAADIRKIHPSKQLKDNYTRNMSGYYGWSRVPTPGPEVLVEHGFVSSPAEQKWLNDNAGELAKAEYAAMLRYFGLPLKPEDPAPSWITLEEAKAAWDAGVPIYQTLPGPKGKPPWFWEADGELQRRRALIRGADDG